MAVIATGVVYGLAPRLSNWRFTRLTIGLGSSAVIMLGALALSQYEKKRGEWNAQELLVIDDFDLPPQQNPLREWIEQEISRPFLGLTGEPARQLRIADLRKKGDPRINELDHFTWGLLNGQLVQTALESQGVEVDLESDQFYRADTVIAFLNDDKNDPDVEVLLTYVKSSD